MGLLYGENCMILTSTVFAWITRVTDGQTDRRNCDSICALTAYAVGRKKTSSSTEHRVLVSSGWQHSYHFIVAITFKRILSLVSIDECRCRWREVQTADQRKGTWARHVINRCDHQSTSPVLCNSSRQQFWGQTFCETKQREGHKVLWFRAEVSVASVGGRPLPNLREWTARSADNQ